ncbi:MAG: PASTA domain-containing protein, partial [Ignavibacteriae bacterium]|nr:PASTA domain-containing protein [Ignavibacteriota bacterium]
PKDHIIFQKPEAGSTVKENRRVYLHISNGNPLTKMPYLIDKTLRDAQITIERMGFVLSEVEEVNSEAKANTIVEQSPNEGANLKRGTKIKLKISVGPNKGQVRVPDLLGMSLKEATETLQMNSLMVGNVSYESSNNLLPNTVITQFPSKSTLVNVGETVDLFVTKN